MKTKRNAPKSLLLTVILSIALITAAVSANYSCSKDIMTETQPKSAQTDEVFVIVEQMPQYPGGDSLMIDFILKNINYPESAKKAGIQGRVFIRFCVTKTGDVDRVSVLKGVDPAINAEAVRVVSLLNNWKPGRQGGQPVNVWFQMPVEFKLGDTPVVAK